MTVSFPRWAGLATFGAAVLIAAFTLVPLPSSGVGGSDKLYHIVAFAVLAFPLSFARPVWVPWVIGAAAAYGGVIELVQPYVGRSAEWADFLADGIGAILGGFVGFVGARMLAR